MRPQVPEGFTAVRVDRQGKKVAVVARSAHYDRPTPVSRGGYWVLLSDELGTTWLPPLYTDLRDNLPYPVPPTPTAPLPARHPFQLRVRLPALPRPSPRPSTARGPPPAPAASPSRAAAAASRPPAARSASRPCSWWASAPCSPAFAPRIA